MHSYKNLAVLALAASAISPALAAPTQESQNPARAELEARKLGMLGGGLGGLALSFLLPNLLGGLGGSSKRSTETETTEALKKLFMAERAYHDHDQRDVTEEWTKFLSGLSKRDDTAHPADSDVLAALKLFGRALNALD